MLQKKTQKTLARCFAYTNFFKEKFIRSHRLNELNDITKQESRAALKPGSP